MKIHQNITALLVVICYEVCIYSPRKLAMRTGWEKKNLSNFLCLECSVRGPPSGWLKIIAPSAVLLLREVKMCENLTVFSHNLKTRIQTRLSFFSVKFSNDRKSNFSVA